MRWLKESVFCINLDHIKAMKIMLFEYEDGDKMYNLRFYINLEPSDVDYIDSLEEFKTYEEAEKYMDSIVLKY